MPTMSSSSGPAFYRRSARSRNVSESSDASCIQSEGKKSATASSGAEQQPRCPTDIKLSENSPERVKRKKRRKNVYDLSVEERNKKVIKRRVAELSRRKRQLEKQLVMVKLNDNRIPIVLLTRYDHHSQPKLEVKEAKREEKEEVKKDEKSDEQKPKEQKLEVQKLEVQKPEVQKPEEQKPEDQKPEEQRVQLPGLNIPAKVDLTILKLAPIVKINKKQTECLIEITKRRQQSKLSVAELSDVRKEESDGSSVVGSDMDKCADKLTEKLDNCSSDDNDHKCTKNNPIVSNSGKRLARLSVDKGSNDKLPDKLLEGNSRSALHSIVESASVGESQPECSKSFVPNNRRLRRCSVDHSNDKQLADSIESKPKCADVVTVKHSESSSKDAKKYSKNLVKDNEKNLQNTIDKSNRRRTDSSDDMNKNTPLVSAGENRACQSEIPHETSRKISRNLVEFSMRSKQNLVSKEHTDESTKNSYFGSSLKCDEKIFEKMDKNIQDLKNRIENQRITRKADSINCLTENVSEKNIVNSTEIFVKEHNKKSSKISNKVVDESTKSETENKRITRRADGKNLEENLIENHVNFVEPINSEPDKITEKSDENNEVLIKIQTEKSKKSTRNISDAIKKHLDDGLENNLKHTQNDIQKSDKRQSQHVDKDIQKCSINLLENKSRIRRNSEKSINVIEEKGEDLSKHLDEKANNISKKFIQSSVENKIQNSSENIDEKDSESSEKSNKKRVKNIDALVTVPKIPVQSIKQNEKITETIKEDTNSTQYKMNAAIDKESKKLSDNLSEINQRPKRKIVKKKFDVYTETLAENSQAKEAISVENQSEKLTENYNKNVNEASKPHTDTVKRRTRKLSGKFGDNTKTSVSSEKVNEIPELTEKNNEIVPETLNTNIQASSEIQTEIKRKRGRPRLTEKRTLVTASVTIEKNKTELKKSDKMITRHSLNYVNEKQNSEVMASSSESTTTSVEEKLKNTSDEAEKIKDSKIETAHQKGPTNLSPSRIQIDKQTENNSSNCDIDESKEKISDEPQKYKKRDLKNCTKMITRNSSPNKQEKYTENLLKSKVNCLNSEEKIPEESQKVIKECSKSQVENYKRTLRKSSPDKHERLTEQPPKKNADSIQSIANKSEMEVSEESQKIIKECSKSQTENNKKVIRKSSPDKHGRNIESKTNLDSVQVDDKVPEKCETKISKQQKVIQENLQISTENTKKVIKKLSSDKQEKCIENDINILDSSQNPVEKSNEKMPEELQKINKYNFKTQIENKRITRKSLPEKQEKSTDTLVTNHLDSSQILISKDNEILSEKLDDKENSKTQIEINARITRNTTLRKDKSSKNLAENNIDFAAALVDENKEKSSDHIVNNVKVLSKNLSDKKIRKFSIDKPSENNTENGIENSNTHLQNALEESNEKQLENQKSTIHSKDLIESRRSSRNLSDRNVTKKPQNIIETNLQRTEHSLEANEEKHSFDIENIISNQISIHVLKNNKRITRKSSEKFAENEIEEKSVIVENLISEFNENERLSKTTDENSITGKQVYNESEINKNVSENINELNSINVSAEINEFHMQITDNAELIETPSKNFNAKNVDNSENLTAAKRIQSFQQSFEKFMEKQANEPSIRCSKRIALKTALKNYESQSELSFEDTSNFEENADSGTNKINFDIMNETEQQLSKELNGFNPVVTQQSVDNDNEKTVENLETDSSKVQEHLVEPKQIVTEELNKSLKNSSRKSEDNKRTTRSSFNKSNEISSETSIGSSNVLLSNQVEEIHEIDSQNTNKYESTCSKMLMTDSAIVESENIDKSDEICFHIISQGDLKTDNNLNNNKVNDIENSSLSNTILPTDVIEENVEKSTSEELVDHIETATNLEVNKTTRELEEKCTSNLDIKASDNQENLENDSINNQTSIAVAENHIGESDIDLNNSLESNKTSTELWSDSCAENATESDSFSDSDETLADRLAKLDSLKIPPMESVESTTQNETEEEKQKQQPPVEKLVLRRCPQASFFELNADFRCKSCDESFFSNRELKKHVKVKHRQRLVIKITKTEENKHVTQIVESLLSPVAKQAEMQEVDEMEEERDSGISTSNADTEDLTSRIDERPADELTDGHITDGEIKIIVRKESGSKNSHVVKEIKITPKSSESGNSSRISNYSPAKSDFSSGSSSHRTAGWSPARFDLSQPAPKKRGRPRKYPIFTEAELIAKQAAATATPTVVNNGGIIFKKNDEELFTPVESIIVQPDIPFNSYESVTIENVENSPTTPNIVANHAEAKIAPLQQNMIECEEHVTVTSGTKRKRTRTLSLEKIVQVGNDAVSTAQVAEVATATEATKVNEATKAIEAAKAIEAIEVTETIVQQEKRPKMSEDSVIENEENSSCSDLGPSDANEQDLSAIYGITKELVVRLTKIDTVPNDSKECNANDNDADRNDVDSASMNSSERPKRKTKPRLTFDEEEEVRRESIKSVIRLNLRNKLENNNNNLKEVESGPVASSSPKRLQKETEMSGIEMSGTEMSGTEMAVAEPVQETVEQNQETQGTNIQQPDVNLMETLNSSLDENAKTVSENELVVTPKSQTIDKAEGVESQTKQMMPLNATTPNEANNINTTAILEMLQKQLQPQSDPLPQPQLQSPSQPQPQPQLQMQSQPQSQLQSQSPPQAQLQSQPQQSSQQPPSLQLQTLQHQIQCPLQSQPPPLLQQQFCILFIPDALYNSDSSINKEVTPTATIVNFQPVPDAEIANKPLIYMPTTPTKISTDEHAKAFVCTTCAEVSDLIGRLEASLGMTEEDKSAIKCPYCSNHFQSLFYLEYHVRQEHLKCENERQCRNSGFNSLRIPTHEAASEFEIYITFALKCRSCYDIFNTVLLLNDHVMHKHKTLVRLRPALPSLSGPASPATSSSASSVYASPFAPRKNGSRPQVFQCPSDCVCRIGIRSTDTPLQRQQMLKRCPNAMRRLEKIEPAAYEVYTCTLCKSTFLMKDEVVDHLMKMHEVSCKFPCYTCLTSFRTLQLQENHRCSETTLQDIDKLLSVAILPTNVSGKTDNNKYLEREDSSSTDEYSATIKSSQSTMLQSPTTPTLRNGFKRKNGATIAALNHFLGVSAAKKAKLGNVSPPPPAPKVINNRRKRKRFCPKCKKRFAYRKSLHDHIIQEHILKGEGDEGPKKMAIELLKLLRDGRANGKRIEELAEMLSGYTDQDGVSLKSLMMMDEDEQENWEESSKEAAADGERSSAQCTRCKSSFKLPAGNLTRHNNHQQPGVEPAKFQLCENCQNSGPKTRGRRTVINNGHHVTPAGDSSSPQQSQQIHPFSCKKCLESFPSTLELKAHKRNVHTKAAEKLFVCDICKKTFASLRMLDKHKKIHREAVLDESAKTEEEDSNRSLRSDAGESSKDGEANDSLNDSKADSSSRRDSSDSSSGGSKEPEKQLLNCSFCEEVCSSKVSLKNHLKREHGRRASICQFCNSLLIDTSEVRHMLDYHIVPSKSSPRRTIVKGNGSILQCDEVSCMEEDVEELIRTLGKQRLSSLMIYHDFEGKCNNAIMRCPICPELFATRESCRFHYVWIHDDNCLLCDETFRSGSSACQHKVEAHTSTASYLWCIQRLVTAIVNTLRLDPNQPSHVLYQILAMRVENEEQYPIELQSINTSCVTEKSSSEEAANAAERFLEEVLSEDQLPDSGNMIEVVIGKEDSEDDLLSMLNLSPNYESCEQRSMPNAGNAPPEQVEEDDIVIPSAPTTPPVYAPVAPIIPMTPTTTIAATTTTTSSPAAETYVTSGVCKYKLDNDEEQYVLVVTDEDLITFRDDIGSLAERISATCDSLTLDDITQMLRAYFESMNAHYSGVA